MEDQTDDGSSAEVSIDVIPIYPVTGMVPAFYANFIGVVTTGEEVYLEIAQIQPQTMDAEAKSAKANVVARVIITKQHAQRLREVLGRSLTVPRGKKKELSQ